MTSENNPMRLGVFGNTSPSLVTLSNGNFEVEFKGGDGYLWLAMGTGTTITSDNNPRLLGVE
ncbi:hypothetical protein [Actinospica sp.]|uniref:hypothetical protein n=1 Tax=Actinospica sp. TaxID=1872142 RepID=UPI002B573BA2|nr:hypothetical protein [Actinospica sp.]HWG25539.1 hypothetical protein [Actinospica sp.]